VGGLAELRLEAGRLSTLEKAIGIAAKAHAGATDKADEPYILHPLRVMLRLTSEDARIVGVLHDVLEDTKVTRADLLAEGFSTAVLEALEAVTKRPGGDLRGLRAAGSEESSGSRGEASQPARQHGPGAPRQAAGRRPSSSAGQVRERDAGARGDSDGRAWGRGVKRQRRNRRRGTPRSGRIPSVGGLPAKVVVLPVLPLQECRLGPPVDDDHQVRVEILEPPVPGRGRVIDLESRRQRLNRRTRQ
jgi:hypothetical protein